MSHLTYSPRPGLYFLNYQNNIWFSSDVYIFSYFVWKQPRCQFSKPNNPITIQIRTLQTSKRQLLRFRYQVIITILFSTVALYVALKFQLSTLVEFYTHTTCLKQARFVKLAFLTSSPAWGDLTSWSLTWGILSKSTSSIRFETVIGNRINFI